MTEAGPATTPSRLTPSRERGLRSHLEDDRALDLALYPVYIDDEERLVYFYVWNLSGQLVGYQHYRPDADKLLKNSPKEGRYFTYLTKVDDRVMLGVWGLESLDFRPDLLFVLEGIFKAVPFHNRRLPAIATMSNNPKQLRNFLWILSRTRRIVFVGDNDAGGSTTRSMGYEMVLPPSHVKDADELTPEEFDAWINEVMENLK